ncbi:hypothetical protein OG535_00260 [Kitasatospora sp. NBC_00085]|uniref:hypothetical protein n=1 Tax=unclassified Kitasatospora TaxID=2633591 RepID=UPI00325019C4
MPHKTTASYLRRLAYAYQVTTTDLLDALRITTTRPAPGPAAPAPSRSTSPRPRCSASPP